MKRIFLISAIALLLSTMIGCEKEDNKIQKPQEQNPVAKEQQLVGTWTSVGFGNSETGEVKTMKSKKYTLKFKEDKTIKGRSSTNLLNGEYKVEGSEFKVVNLGGTEINEVGDGALFMEKLLTVNRYEIAEDDLLLFYSKAEYLLFDTKSPAGFWSIVGYGSTKTDKIERIERKVNCYWLYLSQFDKSVHGRVVADSIHGSYDFDIRFKSIKFNTIQTSKKEPKETKAYIDKLSNKVNSYDFSDKGELLLYYNNKKEWLIFEPY